MKEARSWMNGAARRVAGCSALGALAGLVLLAPVAAQANSSKAEKPSLFVSGIVVNTVNLMPGTKVTDSSGACYQMLGADGSTSSITAVGILDASGIPASATTQIKLVTPWGTVADTGKFDKALFVDPKTTWGGVVPPGNYFRWSNRQGGSAETIDGNYMFSVTVTSSGRTYVAHGAISIGC
jgi:hypothetical protein